MTTLILDIGHKGKPGRNDPGAVWHGVTEVQRVETYCGHTALHARCLGQGVLWPSLPASYYQRQREAAEIARNNPRDHIHFVASHMNFGEVPHAIIGHDARSHGGKRYADAVADQMRARCPWLSNVQVHAVGPKDGSDKAMREWLESTEHAGRWKRNVYALIRHIFAAPANLDAIVYEPCGVGYGPGTTEHALRTYGHILPDAAASL